MRWSVLSTRKWRAANTRRRTAGLGLVVGAILALAGSAAAQSGGVEVRDAWARATPGGAEIGAAYLTIVAPQGDRLTAVSTPAAKEAELHTMSMEGGVMKMRPLEGLDIPAGQPVTLKPGGNHIMLLGLTQPLREGQTFALTLSFDKAGRQQIVVPVEKAGAMAPPGAAGGNAAPSAR